MTLFGPNATIGVAPKVMEDEVNVSPHRFSPCNTFPVKLASNFTCHLSVAMV